MPTRSASTSSVVRVRAFAKINLSLRVMGARPDGYHDLRTIFQSIALHDTLIVERARGPLRLECDDRDCPTDATNLVWRAAAAAWKASGGRGQPRDLVIKLTKDIPIQAGLGGGSSDAAATLRALSRIWRVNEEQLPALAASLGADVPYFLQGGTVLGLDRGDVLFPLVDEPPAWVTLVIPSFGISTKDAYAWFDQDRAHLGPELARPRVQRQAAAGRRKLRPYDSISDPRQQLQNDLEAPVARRHPEIARIVSALRKAGATRAAMSGSGSAVFGLFPTRAAATHAMLVTAGRGRRIILTRTVTREACRVLAAK
jgi:4-diphosphocytidyl-2-C-methyl-D-erythritol kinase